MGVAADAPQVRGQCGAGMSLSFSPLQQRCLDALGYTLYALTGAEAGASVSDPVSGDLEHKRDSTPYPASPRTAHTATQDARDTRLLVAVLRAARVQVDTVADPHSWLIARGVDSIASLRGDPAAKHALWPILRRERRAP